MSELQDVLPTRQEIAHIVTHYRTGVDPRNASTLIARLMKAFAEGRLVDVSNLTQERLLAILALIHSGLDIHDEMGRPLRSVLGYVIEELKHEGITTEDDG